MEREECNGWTNRATWNVALWLREDWADLLEQVIDDIRCCGWRGFKDRIEETIRELEVRQYYLEPIRGGEITQFFTPDGERFDDANWIELFFELIEEPRTERKEREGGVA